MKIRKSIVVIVNVILEPSEWKKICDTDAYDELRDKYNFSALVGDETKIECHVSNYRDADDLDNELRDMLEKYDA